jgi:opacity protein-like surface antigen
MKNIVSLAIAAALALAGVSAAAANQMSNHASKMSGASDLLTLSDTQQKSIWKDVSRQASNQSAPSGFNATVGTAVPSSVSTYPLPLQARRDVPQVRPYRYAMTQDKVLIVNPSDHKIADVVAK